MMKKAKNQISARNKRLLPLLASVTLLSGPVLLVVACSHEISRYPASLPNNEQNRILFDFVGVNYNVNAKSQFSASFKQGMDFIKKEVEGIMAKQEFYNFFVQKLNYSEDNAKAAFTRIQDNLGLNLLAADYFSTVNSGQSFDNKVYASKLIFQTENWHQYGTTRFNYNNVDFYKENNPDEIFTPTNLYSKLDDTKFDALIQKVAKHADDNYNNDIGKLNEKDEKWDSPTTPEQLPPSLGSDTVQNYQKKLERFKWWLRFRYQQYYYSTILPQLNETLFTMASILDSILRITQNNGTPKVEIDNSKYAVQLQDWGPNSAWSSKYRYVWDYTVSQTAADKINREWKDKPLPNLIKKDNGALTLNPDFLNQLAAGDRTVKYTVDPIMGINAFVNDPSSKQYKDAVKANNISNWANNSDGTHYWGQNLKGSFAYSAPIYWIDVIQNLNFNFYNDASKPIVVNTSEDYKGLISSWKNAENSPTSNSDFSQYMRGDDSSQTNPATQEMKWNTMWQMLYFLASQADTNPNKDVAKDNFTTAAKALYPKYIKKENIYNDDFWNAVNSYY